MLELSLDVKEEPVTLSLTNPETGKVEKRLFILAELLGEDNDKYETENAARMKINGEGKIVGFNNLDGQYCDLLCKTVFEAELDEDKKPVRKVDKETGEYIPVREKDVQTWPVRVQLALHDAACKMNGIGKYGPKAEKDAKNA